MLKKFAEELKDTRLKKDITLQQISHKTKIDVKFLEAIENGNYEILPEVYLKAFIKSYASAVGLDETATLKKFEAAKTGKNIDEKNITEATEQKKEDVSHNKIEYIASDSNQSGTDEDEDNSSKASKNNILLLGLGLGLIVVIVIVYLVFFNSSSTEIITEKPYDEVVGGGNKDRFEEQTDTTAAKDTTSQKITAPAFTMKNDSLNLLLKAKDTTWIRVISDNNAKTQDFLLTPNAQKMVRAKKNYRVSVGNAGSIEMFLNNKPLNFVGKRGEVKVVKIDSTGLQYVNLSKPPAVKTNE